MKVLRAARRLLATAILITLSIMLAACTQLASTGFGPNVSVRPPVASVDLIIGTPEDGAQVVTIRNRTGQTVTSVTLKLVAEATFPQPSISQDWDNGQNLKIYFRIPPGASTNQALLFDIELTLADGSVLEMTEIDLLGLHEADLRIDEKTSIAYLASVNALGLPVSTLDQAVAARLAEEEAARAAEAQAAAEAEAAAAAEAAEAAANAGTTADANAAGGAVATAAPESADASYGYSYDTGSGSSGTGSTSGSGGVAQSSDVCVDDLILR
jgi:hypothetical protein